TLASAGADPMPRVSEVSPRLSGSFDDVVGAGLAEAPAQRPTLNAFTAGLVAALGRSTGADVAVEPGPVVAPDPMADTATIVVPVQATRVPPAAARRPTRAAAPRSAPRRSLTLGTVLLALVFLAIGVLALSGLSALWHAAGQVPGGPTSAASASPTPTESP